MKRLPLAVYALVLFTLLSTTLHARAATPTQAIATPTPYIYAQLSSQVYTENGGVPPQGWEVLTTSTKEGISAEGYFGAAYINRTTKQMIIAHRGTDCSPFYTVACMKDLFGDDSAIARGAMPEQMDHARDFTQHAYIAYRTLFHLGSDVNIEPLVSFTGHSLGAILAELCAHEFNSTATTFDSPGSRPIREKRGEFVDDTRVISYQSYPHFVNRCSVHIGHIYQIYPLLEQTTTAFGQALDRHSIEKIAEQFNPATGQPYVVADMGIVPWQGLENGKFVDGDFDNMPYYWWNIHLASDDDAVKKIFISVNLGGGVQNPKPKGVTIIGDNYPNQIVGDTTGDDTLIPGGGADEVFSYGGNDTIVLGVNDVPDGQSDMISVVTTPGTKGARLIRQADPSDLLTWDDHPVEGLAERTGSNTYRLKKTYDGNMVTFNLTLADTTLLIELQDQADNSVTISDFSEGVMGIYLDARSVTPVDGENVIKGTVTKNGKPEIIEGTAQNDIVDADGDYQSCYGAVGKAFDDIIHTYAGDDIIRADNGYCMPNSSASWGDDVIDAGPGNDVVDAAPNMGRSDPDINVIYLGPGNDIGNGSPHEQDYIYGGEGDDIISNFQYASGGSGNDRLSTSIRGYADGGPGNDSMLAAGICDGQPIVLNGNSGSDELSATNCTTVYMNGGAGVNKYKINVDSLNGFTQGKIIIIPGPQDHTSSSYGIFYGGDLMKPIKNDGSVRMQYQKTSGVLIIKPKGAISTMQINKDEPQIIVQNFYNGMFGITDVTDAPTLPSQPWVPGESNQEGVQQRVCLPLITK